MANYTASDITTDEQAALDQIKEETEAAVKYDIAAKNAKDPVTKEAMEHNKKDELQHAGLMGAVATKEEPEDKDEMMKGVEELDHIMKKSISQCIKERQGRVSSPGSFESFEKARIEAGRGFGGDIPESLKSHVGRAHDLDLAAKNHLSDEVLQGDSFSDIGRTGHRNVSVSPGNEVHRAPLEFSKFWPAGGNPKMFMTGKLRALAEKIAREKAEREALRERNARSYKDQSVDWYKPEDVTDLEDAIALAVDDFLGRAEREGLQYDVPDRSGLTSLSDTKALSEMTPEQIKELQGKWAPTAYEQAIGELVDNLDSIINDSEKYGVPEELAARLIDEWTPEDESASAKLAKRLGAPVWSYNARDPSKKADMSDWHITEESMPEILNRSDAYAKRDYALRLAKQRMRDQGHNMRGSDIGRLLAETAGKAGWVDKRLKSAMLFDLIKKGYGYLPEDFKDIYGDELMKKATGQVKDEKGNIIPLTMDDLSDEQKTAANKRFEELYGNNYIGRNIAPEFNNFETMMDLYNFVIGFGGSDVPVQTPILDVTPQLAEGLRDAGIPEDRVEDFMKMVGEQVSNGGFVKNGDNTETLKGLLKIIGIDADDDTIDDIYDLVNGAIYTDEISPEEYERKSASALMYEYNRRNLEREKQKDAKAMLDFINNKENLPDIDRIISGPDAADEHFEDYIDENGVKKDGFKTILANMAAGKLGKAYDKQYDSSSQTVTAPSIYNSVIYNAIKNLMDRKKRTEVIDDAKARKEAEIEARQIEDEKHFKTHDPGYKETESDKEEEVMSREAEKAAGLTGDDAANPFDMTMSPMEDAKDTLSKQIDSSAKNMKNAPNQSKLLDVIERMKNADTIPANRSKYTAAGDLIKGLQGESWISSYANLISNDIFIKALNDILAKEAPGAKPIEGNLFSAKNADSVKWLDDNGYIPNLAAEDGSQLADDLGIGTDFQNRLSNAITSMDNRNAYGLLDFLDNFDPESVRSRLPKDMRASKRARVNSALDAIAPYLEKNRGADAAKIREIESKLGKWQRDKNGGLAKEDTYKLDKDGFPVKTPTAQKAQLSDEDKDAYAEIFGKLTDAEEGKTSVLDALKALSGQGGSVMSPIDLDEAMDKVEETVTGDDAGEKGALKDTLKKVKGGQSYKAKTQDFMRRMSRLIGKPIAMTGGSDKPKLDANGVKQAKGKWGINNLAALTYVPGALERDARTDGSRSPVMGTPDMAQIDEKLKNLEKVEAQLAEEFPDGEDNPRFATRAKELVDETFGDVVNFTEPKNFAPHMMKLINDIYDTDFELDDRADLKRLRKLYDLHSKNETLDQFVPVADKMYQNLSDAIGRRDATVDALMKEYTLMAPADRAKIDWNERLPGVDLRYKADLPIDPEGRGTKRRGWEQSFLSDLANVDYKTGLPRNISKILPVSGVTFDDDVVSALAAMDEPAPESEKTTTPEVVPTEEVVEEEKVEEEPEKVAKPIKKSATESRCTRVRHRSDADDLPDDTGLTEKDLREPTIHNDANGSSVKKVGDGPIKKSISELMTERLKRDYSYTAPQTKTTSDGFSGPAVTDTVTGNGSPVTQKTKTVSESEDDEGGPETKGIAELMKERMSRRK